MFVTDQLTPAEMLAELLSLKGWSKADTERFRTLKHDRDLCPEIRERVSDMLDAYKSHRTDVQDTQGPRDDGVDVLLTYSNDGQHRVGLQIKSFDEIEAWVRKDDTAFVKTLKAQYASALQNVKVEDYYLLLCTDEVAHSKKIRSICSELKSYERLKIILPRQALAFYELPSADVQAFVARLLCQHDGVLETARTLVGGMPRHEARLLIGLICRAFATGQPFLSDEEFQEVCATASDDGDPAQFSDVLWDPQGVGLQYENGELRIDLTGLPKALCALYFDAAERHGARGTYEYLIKLLDVNPGRRLRRRRSAARPMSD